jgi:DNA polymerase-3 subunit alpha
MGKKKQEIIDREGQNFIDGAIAKGYPKNKVRELWNQIVPFAKYGFNKSHSVAYAHVAYLTAYLKTHYPAHFMAAMLTSEASTTDKLSQYLGRSRQMGIKILPPDINTSLQAFSVEPEGIRFGLTAIKGLGDAAIEPLLAAREAAGGFDSLSHCLISLPARAINQKALECMTKAGCFDRFGLPRKGVLDNLDRLVEMAAREREQRELGQGFLFADMPSETLEAEIRAAERVNNLDRLAWEREVLGFYLSGHPLDDFRPQLERYADTSIADLSTKFQAGAESATVGGLVSALKVIPIKKEGRNQGRRMAVFQLEDASGAVRAVVFPDTFESLERVIQDGAALLVTATLKGDGDHVELMVDEAADLVGLDSKKAAGLRIVLDLDSIDEDGFDAIREYLLDHPGDMPVRFDLRRRGRFRARLVPPPALSVDPSQETREGLEPLLAGGRCEFEFDTAKRNGKASSPPPPPAAALADGESGVVN